MILTELKVRDGGGWEWTVTDDDRTIRYRTDGDREGLWVWVEDGPSQSWKQLRGHIQVSWPKGRRGMLNRLKTEYGYTIRG